MQNKHAEHLAPGTTNLSLSSVLGKKVTDIQGYISMEFGDPVFSISKIIFEDNSSMSVEGEHDMAYLCYDDHVSGFTDEDLLALCDPEDDEG